MSYIPEEIVNIIANFRDYSKLWKTNIYIPEEIVDIIADFHDYEKYCKPKHKKNYEIVMSNILEISIYEQGIIHDIKPSIAKKFWGNSWENLMEDYEEQLYDEIYFVGTSFDMNDGYDN